MACFQLEHSHCSLHLQGFTVRSTLCPRRPHYSGTTLDAQARYAAGTKEILRRTFDNEPLNETDVIVQV